MKKFDLNISNAKAGWNVATAVKEILADCLEEQQITKSSEVEIFKSEDGAWHIRDYGRGMKYTHLARSEYGDNMSYIYKGMSTGESLGDAIGTLDHNGVELIIDSKYSHITFIRTNKYGFEGVETILALVDAPVDPNRVGSEFTLKGIKDSDITAAQNMFLKYRDETPLEVTKYGEIYARTGSYGEIFVNGIKIAQEPYYLFSYNLTSSSPVIAKSLAKERAAAGQKAYRERIKSILKAAKSEAVIDVLTEDLNRFSEGTLSDELEWPGVAAYAAIKLNSRSDVLFLTPKQLQKNIGKVGELVWRYGKEIVFVNGQVMSKLEGQLDDNGNPVCTLATLK